jgi:hypothetical protein
MTLSDISSIVGVISGLAVLGSLVYLAQQTRQNTKHTRALIFQGTAELALSQFHAMAEPELAASIIIGNGGTPTPEEIRHFQFNQVCTSCAVVWDNLVAQHDEGLVNAAHFQRIRWAWVQKMQANPGVREVLKLMVSSAGAPDHRLYNFVRDVVRDAEKLPGPNG